ncbi:MAG: peptidyl-prolyl cis-trans isomerase [Fibromonadaceae bacterium]|jgi:tetratricopeptide (TPR) repeat protein|nr:peptidyl-prolyl cis-trans isomerase [Fibromonadaceae bacterium]
MRKSFVILVASLASLVLFGCSLFPQDRPIAKIGNTSLFTSDVEFLAATRPESARNKKSIAPDLQQVAETRRMAEVARLLFAGEQNSIQKKLEEGESGRLAQIYVYLYLQANLGYNNKALLDFYKKNEGRYTDSSMLSASMPVANFREKIAADLFLKENAELAARVNDTNKAAIIDSCRREMMNAELDRLKKLYKVELVKIEPPALEEYYKGNPEQFQTRAMYKLLNLSDKDSAALAGKIKKISTREEFAKIAVEMPLVKQGHAIMNIGMLPALDEEVSKLGAKKFTPVLRAPDVNAYYVFYIDSIVEPQLKPWDRAKDFAKSVVESKGDFPLDSSVVLVTIGGKPFITEREVLEFRAKLGPRQQMLRRSAIISNLIEEGLYARAAKEKGLDKSVEYIAWTRQIADRLYVRVLMDSILTYTLGIPEEALKTAYESEKDSLFLPKSFEDSKLDVAVWLRIPDISYRREFVLNRQKYGDAASWENIRRSAYKNIRYNEFSSIQEREQANLRKSVPVAIIDTSWGLEFTSDNFAELAEQAKIQYNNQNPQKAKELWEKARTLFPQSDSIQRTTSYELASVYQDLGQYGAAIDEYKVIAGLWGNEPDAYKAYFMQGFVLSEYEKKDSLALLAFEEMLKKFPNSELSEDARVMVANIKSGGKILEELIKKIESSSEE